MHLFADLIRKGPDQPRDALGRWIAIAVAEEAKGREAVRRVLRGEEIVPNAMHRAGVGHIDFRRGDASHGVLHIQQKHGDAVLNRVPSIIARGRVGVRYTVRGRMRVNIEHEGHTVVLATDHADGGGPWLLTGFGQRVRKSAPDAVAPGPLTGSAAMRHDLALDRFMPGAGAPWPSIGRAQPVFQLFADIMKGQPSVASVHVGTALGNDAPPRRRKFVPRLSAFIGQTRPAIKLATPRELTPLDEKRSHVPFPHDAAALASLRTDQVPRFLGALTDPDSLPVQTVNLADLTAVQNRIDTAKAKAWAGGSIKSDRLPVVVRANGRNLIADGHHRLAGAWLRGDATAKVRFKDLEPITNAMKRADLDWSMPLDVRKADPDRRQVFGWASVIEKNGEPIIDKQGDIIPVSALEPAAYDFVLFSRDQGDMHEETGKGRLIESMMFTTEKQKALGIDLGMVGWWTGFQVDSPALWSAYKRGERPEFSIGGQAVSREA